MDRNQGMHRYWLWLVALALLQGLALQGSAHGQAESVPPAYDVLPMAPEYVLPVIPDNITEAERKALKKKETEVNTLIRNGKAAAQAVLRNNETRDAAFDAYFNNYVFPAMAQADDATVSRVGILRQAFIKDFVNGSTGQARTYLVETLTLPTCQKLAAGNYHPSVRLNAVYLASQLDERDFEAQKQLPIPSRSSVAFLTQLCSSPDTPPYLVAAAVSGLARVVELESAEAHGIDLAPIRSYSVAALSGQAPGQANWDADMDYWVRKRAVQILGFLKDGSSVPLLSNLIGDSSQPALMRLEAANSFARVNLAGIDSAELNKSTMALVAFAGDSLAAEADGLKNTIEDLVAINLLWRDTYIIDPNYVTPADGADDTNDLSGDGGRGGGRGGGDRGGGRGGGMGAGSGSGADGSLQGGPEGNSGGAGASAKLKSWREFNLPNYHLNLVRRRLKINLFVCQTALEALARTNQIAGNEKAALDQTLVVIRTALKDANEGLVDLAAEAPANPVAPNPLDADKPKTSPTIKLMEFFQQHSLDIRKLLPEQAAEPGAADASAPAGTAG